MSNDKFLSQTTMVNSDGDTVDYFGGEKFNAEFAEAAKRVTSKFNFCPAVYDEAFSPTLSGRLTQGRTTMKEGVRGLAGQSSVEQRKEPRLYCERIRITMAGIKDVAALAGFP